MCYDHSSTSRIGQAFSLLWSSSSILMTHVLWKFNLFHIQLNFYVSPHEKHYCSYLYYIQFPIKINRLSKYVCVIFQVHLVHHKISTTSVKTILPLFLIKYLSFILPVVPESVLCYSQQSLQFFLTLFP